MIKVSEENFHLLQKEYWQLSPSQIPAKYLSTYEDIINLYNFLKSTKPNISIANKIADIIIERLETKKRFQKYPLIRLLKIHTLSFSEKGLTCKLFKVYQQLIFCSNEQTCWALSTLLKNRELNHEQIEWLLQNAEKSDYILNRVLRYPIPEQDISEWARYTLYKGLFKKRKSELLALIINHDPSFRDEDVEAMIWAVYYSKLSDEINKKLLLCLLTDKYMYDFIEVSKRKGYLDLIEEVYKHNEKLRG